MKTTRLLTMMAGVTAISSVMTVASYAEADKGKIMTQALCMSCHGDAQAGQKRLAPPMAMVKSHYKPLGKKAMVQAIAKWVKKPDAKHSRMPGAIRNFGLMPPLALPDADLQAIASYVAKTKFAMPKGCGPGPGQGRGRGRGRGK